MIVIVLVTKVAHGDDATPEKTLAWKYDERMERLLAPIVTWDLNLEGGYGHLFADPGKGSWLGRVRAGVTVVRRPFYWSFGGTYDASVFSSATFGLQGEVTWLAYGPWAQAGGLVDVDGKVGGMAAIGIAVIGVEAQLRDSERFGDVLAVFGKLHLPISIFYRAIAVSEEVRREREEREERKEREQKKEQGGREIGRETPALPTAE